MKYFFTTSIASADGVSPFGRSGAAQDKSMIDAETAATILSDDAIVTRLKDAGIDMRGAPLRNIAKPAHPLSVERKREKSAMSA